jgi:hypothetical protein
MNYEENNNLPILVLMASYPYTHKVYKNRETRVAKMLCSDRFPSDKYLDYTWK